MEIQGKVIAVLPIKDGVGKTSGNQWENRWFNTLTAWEVTVIKAKEA